MVTADYRGGYTQESVVRARFVTSQSVAEHLTTPRACGHSPSRARSHAKADRACAIRDESIAVALATIKCACGHRPAGGTWRAKRLRNLIENETNQWRPVLFRKAIMCVCVAQP